MISFPRSNSDSDKVTLKGSRDCIEGTKAQIQEVVKELVTNLTNAHAVNICLFVLCLFVCLFVCFCVCARAYVRVCVLTALWEKN